MATMMVRLQVTNKTKCSAGDQYSCRNAMEHEEPRNTSQIKGATCRNWSGTSEDLSEILSADLSEDLSEALSEADSVVIESSRPANGLPMLSSPLLPSCCLDGEGARAEGIGEELELFMTLLGSTGGLGVLSLGTERGAGGSKKSKADARSTE